MWQLGYVCRPIFRHPGWRERGYRPSPGRSANKGVLWDSRRMLKRSVCAAMAVGALSASVVAVTPSRERGVDEGILLRGHGHDGVGRDPGRVQHQHVGGLRVRAPRDHEHGLAPGLHHQQQAQAGAEQPAPQERRPDQHQPPDHRLHAEPQGSVVRRHAHHGGRLHLQLAGPERQHRLHRRRWPGLRHGVDRRLQPDPVRDRVQPLGRRRLRAGQHGRPQRRPVPERAHRHGGASSRASPTGAACSPTSFRRTSRAPSAGTPASWARRRRSRAAGT